MHLISRLCLVTALGWLMPTAGADTTVTDTRQITPANGVTLVTGRVQLPSKGAWQLETVAKGALTEIFLEPHKIIQERNQGKRKLLDEQKIRQQDKYPLSRLYAQIHSWATTHEGMAPNVEELPKLNNLLLQKERRSHLLPPIQLLQRDEIERWRNKQPAAPLAVELTPRSRHRWTAQTGPDRQSPLSGWHQRLQAVPR